MVVFQVAIESVQGQPFQNLCSEIAKLHDIGPASFAAAIDFLQGAGQSKNITQVGFPLLFDLLSSHLDIQ